MVIDKIENFKLYERLSNKIAMAFAYINETDFSQIALGKYEIEKDDVFALVQEYDTKDKSEGKLEGHRKYIDVQYIVSGTEFMGVAPLSKQNQISNNDEKDISFYDGDASFLKLDTGMFTIFFPDDLHMPCIKFNQISKVRKVVIKVRV